MGKLHSHNQSIDPSTGVMSFWYEYTHHVFYILFPDGHMGCFSGEYLLMIAEDDPEFSDISPEGFSHIKQFVNTIYGVTHGS